MTKKEHLEHPPLPLSPSPLPLIILLLPQNSLQLFKHSVGLQRLCKRNSSILAQPVEIVASGGGGGEGELGGGRVGWDAEQSPAIRDTYSKDVRAGSFRLRLSTASLSFMAQRELACCRREGSALRERVSDETGWRLVGGWMAVVCVWVEVTHHIRGVREDHSHSFGTTLLYKTDSELSATAH